MYFHEASVGQDKKRDDINALLRTHRCTDSRFLYGRCIATAAITEAAKKKKSLRQHHQEEQQQQKKTCGYIEIAHPTMEFLCFLFFLLFHCRADISAPFCAPGYRWACACSLRSRVGSRSSNQANQQNKKKKRMRVRGIILAIGDLLLYTSSKVNEQHARRIGLWFIFVLHLTPLIFRQRTTSEKKNESPTR